MMTFVFSLQQCKCQLIHKRSKILSFNKLLWTPTKITLSLATSLLQFTAKSRKHSIDNNIIPRQNLRKNHEKNDTAKSNKKPHSNVNMNPTEALQRRAVVTPLKWSAISIVTLPRMILFLCPFYEGTPSRTFTENYDWREDLTDGNVQVLHRLKKLQLLFPTARDVNGKVVRYRSGILDKFRWKTERWRKGREIRRKRRTRRRRRRRVMLRRCR